MSDENQAASDTGSNAGRETRDERPEKCSHLWIPTPGMTGRIATDVSDRTFSFVYRCKRCRRFLFSMSPVIEPAADCLVMELDIADEDFDLNAGGEFLITDQGSTVISDRPS